MLSLAWALTPSRNGRLAAGSSPGRDLATSVALTAANPGLAPLMGLGEASDDERP